MDQEVGEGEHGGIGDSVWANWTVEGLFVPLDLPSADWLLHLTGRGLQCRVESYLWLGVGVLCFRDTCISLQGTFQAERLL